MTEFELAKAKNKWHKENQIVQRVNVKSADPDHKIRKKDIFEDNMDRLQRLEKSMMGLKRS